MREHQWRPAAIVPEDDELGVRHIDSDIGGVAVVVDDDGYFEIAAFDLGDNPAKHLLDVLRARERRDPVVVHERSVRTNPVPSNPCSA